MIFSKSRQKILYYFLNKSVKNKSIENHRYHEFHHKEDY